MIRRSLAVCVLLALSGGARAELISEQPQQDAGQVRSGAALVHRFTLVNVGKEQITIGEPKSGCGCLRSTVERTTLAPGQKTTVTTEIHTVTQSTGENTWTVLVPYRQPSQEGAVLLRVKADVIPELTIAPASLIFHTDTSLSHSLTLTERRQEPLAIRSASTTSPHVKARVSEPSKQSDGWQRVIGLDLGADCPEGRHEHILAIYTSDANYPELKIPFTVVKRSSDVVRASPAEVEWRAKPGDPLPAKIVLISAGSNDEPVM